MKQFLAILFVLNVFLGTRAAAQTPAPIRPQVSQVPEATASEPRSGFPMPSSAAPQPAQQPHYPVQNNPGATGYAAPGQTGQDNVPPPATPYPAPAVTTQQPAAAPATNPVANPPTPGAAPNVSNDGAGEYGQPAATPTVVAATPLPATTAAPPLGAATPIPFQQPAQLATPASNTNTSRSSRTPAATNETSNQRTTATSATASPLWKVGGVVLTLLGLLVLVVFTPAFSALTKSQQALIWAGGACAGIAQLTDTFAGMSAAASPAQCMLALAGFGGITASGFIDGHRNRAVSGVLWLAASALVTHSLLGPQASGAFSGILAVASAVCALALCAVSFSVIAASESQDVASTSIAPTVAPSRATLPATTPRPVADPTPQKRTPLTGRTGAKQAGKGVARLVAVEGPLKGQVFTLMEGANAAGGDVSALDGNKIHLPGDDKVARVHAILMCMGNRCTVSDMASATGVFLNGGKVLDERDLMNGDRLQIGGTIFLYQRA